MLKAESIRDAERGIHGARLANPEISIASAFTRRGSRDVTDEFHVFLGAVCALGYTAYSHCVIP